MSNETCACDHCNAVERWPQMPALRPLSYPVGLWRVDCHWVSPAFDGCAVRINRGFLTDGASIPRAAWRVIGHPFISDLLPFALGHDALYSAELMPRADCDKWFLETMKLGGIGWIKRNSIWSAVRTFGAFVWKAHTPHSIEAARKLCFIDHS